MSAVRRALEDRIASIVRVEQRAVVGDAPFLDAELQKVLERIDAGGRNVRVVLQIERDVERGRGIAPFRRAGRMKVVEWIDAGGRNVRIGREISGDIEIGVRVASFLPADGLEMPERI